ncbi:MULTISPECIES: hypothetical protein [Actinoalloteichus]|uniref:hypothetical protein n=1 Tax=Actinoalloteichus TaxID=65496 RepID=UPI0012DED282|nr:hypothetical protein [Actinoalloteichus caeruleus]
MTEPVTLTSASECVVPPTQRGDDTERWIVGEPAPVYRGSGQRRADLVLSSPSRRSHP